MRLDSRETKTGSAPIPVTAFVDWNSQMHNAGVSRDDPHEKARRTLTWIFRVIGRALTQQAPAARFNVVFRLYHGWYKGWEPTENYRAITRTVSEIDFFSLGRTARVAFSSEVEYGHALLAALPERRHVNPPIHLPNTWRQQSGDSPRVEKMVDTALAADLLEWARESRNGWAIVLSEDDDVVPPILAAEAWMKPRGGCVLPARVRRRTRRPPSVAPRSSRGGDQYLKLDGLLVEVQR